MIVRPGLVPTKITVGIRWEGHPEFKVLHRSKKSLVAVSYWGMGYTVLLPTSNLCSKFTGWKPRLIFEHQWSTGWSVCYWNGRRGFDSWWGLTKDYKNWCSQLPCLTFSNKKGESEASTVCGKQVGRWQLDSKTERSLRYLLAKGIRWIKCNYFYNNKEKGI